MIKLHKIKSFPFRFLPCNGKRYFSIFNTNNKLIKLVNSFKKFDIDSYFLPHNDQHNSEYLSKFDKRIDYISGFSGSNALAFISQSEAILWTDSRYFIQAKNQLEPEWTFKKLLPNEKKWFEYVIENYKNKNCFKIGVDPSIISANSFEEREKDFLKHGIQLKPIKNNLIDELRGKNDNESVRELFIHDEKYSGLSVHKKIILLWNKIQESQNDNIHFCLLTELDEIAWLLNLRGEDIPYNPVFKSYVLIEFDHSNKYHAWIYIDSKKITSEIANYLSKSNFEIKSYEEINTSLTQINKNILINKSSCNYALYKNIPANFVINQKSPVKYIKAVKNQTEIEGYRNCHLRDGRSVIRFFTWLSYQIKDLQIKNLSEFEAAIKCDEFRSMNEDFKGLSFNTISATGPNSAIVHYSPHPKKSNSIDLNSMYLVDSGGHYWDGTTDITRTMHFGNPTMEEKTAYTLVLLGNLNLERTIWPNDKEITGADLEVIARRSLWQRGLDYGHGTGHGVGHFLNVHEGPHGINKKTTEVLKENMIVTNEPGYYKEGVFGIRVENCLLIQKSNIEKFLKFENLTKVPYDINLIELSLLHKEDIQHINRYHNEIKEIYLPYFEKNNERKEADWLIKATAEIN